MPEADAQTIDAGATEQAAGADTGVAEQQGSTEAATSDFEAPFRLEDVPEGVRQHVEHYIQQTRPKVTQAFQSAAEQRRQAEAALELQQALESPETAYEPLRDLLERFGLELPEDTWQQALTGDEEDYEGEGESLSPEVQEALEFIRQQKEQAEADAEAAEVEALRSHVNSHLAALAETRGYGEQASDVPDIVRDVTAAVAAVRAPGADGLPDLAGAQELLDAYAAHEFTRRLKAKTGHDVPRGGTQGEDRIDPRSAKDRLALAQQVAGRHFAGQS